MITDCIGIQAWSSSYGIKGQIDYMTWQYYDGEWYLVDTGRYLKNPNYLLLLTKYDITCMYTLKNMNIGIQHTYFDCKISNI
jgi:hypothetical protein